MVATACRPPNHLHHGSAAAFKRRTLHAWPGAIKGNTEELALLGWMPFALSGGPGPCVPSSLSCPILGRRSFRVSPGRARFDV